MFWKMDKDSSEESSEKSADYVGDENDLTCCHRMTLFSPRIRNILITEPILKGLGHITWAHLFSATTMVGLVVIIWVLLYLLLGNTMLPNNHGFGFYSLLVLSNLLGRCISWIPYLNLPPVIGMLAAGIIVRNSGLYNIHQDLAKTATRIRTFCLTFVAIRAGLQLSTTSLKKNPVFQIVLAIIPCTMEMFMITLCCRYILLYPWDWSFMTGTILACISPVVTVNCVLALAERGYGEDKGLGSILCTASTFENVHLVSLFAICYSNIFANDEENREWWSYVPVGLRDAVLGIGVGVTLGTFFVFFPHRSHVHAKWYRLLGLVVSCVICTTATARVTISGGGYLAAMVLSFVANTGWKILSGSYDTTLFRRTVFLLWKFVQPILVGLVGADMDFAHYAMSRFGLHLSCILIGLVARSLTVLIITYAAPFTWKERLFVIICWLPKGALQAALGPMAYERARSGDDEWTIEMALDVVEAAFLTMLVLTPIGSLLINFAGPRLLNRVTTQKELQYLRTLSLVPPPPRQLKSQRLSNVAIA